MAAGGPTRHPGAGGLRRRRALPQGPGHPEDYASRAPSAVRIDVVAGVKRYLREGTAR